MITLTKPENHAILSLQTEMQKQFNANSRDYADLKIDWRKPIESGEEDGSLPLPVSFAWETDAENAEAVLEITRDEAFTRIFRTVNAENTVDVYNFEIGETYFWRVRAGGEVSETRSFAVADILPRWIYIDGTTNVRDLGGWKTSDGRRMKQGLLYRGSELNAHRTITEKGIEMLRDTLGVKTDLDLRGEAVGVYDDTPLGRPVAFRLLPLLAYDELVADRSSLVPVFEVLADPAAYPIYFHCWGGADRTGSLGCYIEALCGVSEEDVCLDYELTSLGTWGVRSAAGEGFTAVLDGLHAYREQGADTLQKQARAFLLDAGIKEETLDRVYAILMGDM